MKNPKIVKTLANGSGKGGRPWYLYEAEILPGVSVVGFGLKEMADGDDAHVQISSKKGQIDIQVKPLN